MITRFFPLRHLAPLAALGLLSGCGSLDAVQNLIPHHQTSDENLNAGVIPRQIAGKPATKESERPVVLPVSSQDINCPPVDVQEGGAAARVGGPDNASVHHQFNIGDTARQCDPAGPGQVAIKIGVSGDLVIGPAGTGGTFSAPLHISIIQDSDKKPVFSKTFTVQASSDGVKVGAFRVVTDPVVLPMPTLQLPDIYTITVGFGQGGEQPKAKAHRRRRPA